MYRNSFKELQVDRIDYLLLHGVGMGGGMKRSSKHATSTTASSTSLLSEREAGRIRNLGFSYRRHRGLRPPARGARPLPVGFQCRSSSTTSTGATPREVNTRNTDAEYLYGELSRRGIPAVIMEPLLGGRLSNVHDHIAAKLRQRRPRAEASLRVAFRWGSFPGVLTVLSGMTYMEYLQDNLRTSRRSTS